MKKAIRKMTFSKNDSYIKPLFKMLYILDFQSTLDLNLGKLMWNAATNNFPKCLLDTLNFDTLTSSNRKVIYTVKQYKANFITTTGTLLWKCIPNQIKGLKNKK